MLNTAYNLIDESTDFYKNSDFSTYEVVLLSHTDSEKIKTFHDHVVQALALEHKGFLRQKDLADIKNHFQSGDDVIAILEQGKIIAQCFVDYHIRDAAMIGGLSVSPESAGKGYVQLLLSAAKNLTMKKHKKKLMARVGIKNIRSLNSFLKAGFDIEQTIFLHKEDRYVHLMQLNTL